MEALDFEAWSPPEDTCFRRRMIHIRYLLLHAFVVSHGYFLRTLGNVQTGCSWTFCPNGLGPKSIIYSGGVGNDITFEHALAKEFGCTVNLLDPSPTGIATMKLPENTNSQLKFLPIGLAGEPCTLRFAPPVWPQEGSWFTHESKGSLEAACLDLGSLMKQNHHFWVDLVKLDIEGSEYGVIENILDATIPVRQILVEFHHGLLPGIQLTQSLRTGFRLLRHGYVLISIFGTTYSFIRRNWPP